MDYNDHHPDLAHPLQTQRPTKIYCDECRGQYGKCWCVGGDIGEKKTVDTSDKLKDTNPKDAVGVRKFPITTIPLTVMAEVGLAMMEGARKYGKHNYRVEGVRASVYIDAAFRHLSKWWDGSEDIDPDSGLSHIIKAIASLTVLRDAQICKSLFDDRPISSPEGFFASLDSLASKIIDKYPNCKEPYLKINNE